MTDEELGREINRRRNAACKGLPRDYLEFAQRRQLGAMVRLLRGLLSLLESMAADEIAKIYSISMDPELRAKGKERLDLLSEARGLVGEEGTKHD